MIGSLISGCRYIKENENKFREFRTISGDSIFYTKYAFTESVKGKVFQLTYSNSSNREYYLSRIEGFDNRVVYNGIDTQQLFLAGKRYYRIEQDDFLIYKFIENKGTTDGEVSVFWSPSYGIILERTNTWKSMKKLIATENESQADTIAILCDFIFRDVDFYGNEQPDSTIIFVTPSVGKDYHKINRLLY
jgi:hypothetical protein